MQKSKTKGVMNLVFRPLRSLTNPVVKDEQILFVNRKADGLPEAKATRGSVDFSFSLPHVHGICQRINYYKRVICGRVASKPICRMIRLNQCPREYPILNSFSYNSRRSCFCILISLLPPCRHYI